jgi:hypothetical protein
MGVVPPTFTETVLNVPCIPGGGLSSSDPPEITFGAVIGIVVTAVVGLVVAAVAGNAAVTTPVPAELIADVDPAMVKKFADTPVKVYPESGVSVMVAVYMVTALNVASEGDQLTVLVYWPLLATVATGIAPVTGGVTPGIAAVVITVR